eukprot:TRINITY_DN792_c0_g1_i1.p1 TRINITY_DN792_c0_g1~~TRINITY_DN792_c0_g1_i1.p1  ORF type:complete len:209 (-),score=22.64 TRINITY_DN792_c0_g1_i1:348-974(-)
MEHKDAAPQENIENNENNQETASLDDFSVKHPLQHAWCWWYDNNSKKKPSATNWGDNLKNIYSFNTVEDFWCLWNNIKSAEELAHGSNYHLFKEGIEPKWEDPANAKGGKWTVTFKKSDTLNDYWLYTVLACIGCVFDDDDHICGAVVSLRKGGHKINLWTKDANDAEICKRIGSTFKGQLNTNLKITYQAHEMSGKNNYGKSYKYEI